MLALGRRFQVGNLYDYRSDAIISGADGTKYFSLSLLPEIGVAVIKSINYFAEDHLTYDADKLVNDFKKFMLELSCEESAKSNWEVMGLDEHLQASTMAGLIGKYRGASNYLNDKKNHSQVSKTLVFRAKSRKERLDAKHFQMEDVRRILEETNATHVVVGVTYGVEAYCVLTQDLDIKCEDEEAQEECRDEAKKNLSNWGSKLLDALEEETNVTDFQKGFSEEERKSLTGIKCRLYADLQAQIVRECSVIDAYKHLIKLIEQVQINDKESKAVLISIVLCPLQSTTKTGKRDGRRMQYRDVDSDLVSRCCRIFTKLDNVSCEAEIVRATNKNIRTSLRPFIEAIDKYQLLLKKELKTAVVKARESEDGDNEELNEVAIAAENHPLFKPKRLKLWLEYKKAELEILETINKTKGIPLFGSQALLTNELANSEKKYALVLSMPPVDKRTKEILTKMKECLESGKIFIVRSSEEEEDGTILSWHHMHWRKRKQVLGNKIRELADYAERNKHLKDTVHFLMVISDVNKEAMLGKELCKYSVYEFDNILKENIGRLPSPPTGLKIKVKTSSSVLVEWDHEELDYPYHYLVKYKMKFGDETWKQKKLKASEHQMTINLEEGSEMEIRVAVDTCIGRSKFSDIFETDQNQSFEAKIKQNQTRIIRGTDGRISKMRLLESYLDFESRTPWSRVATPSVPEKTDIPVYQGQPLDLMFVAEGANAIYETADVSSGTAMDCTASNTFGEFSTLSGIQDMEMEKEAKIVPPDVKWIKDYAETIEDVYSNSRKLRVIKRVFLQDVEAEEALQKLNHPNVIKLLHSKSDLEYR